MNITLLRQTSFFRKCSNARRGIDGVHPDMYGHANSTSGAAGEYSPCRVLLYWAHHLQIQAEGEQAVQLHRVFPGDGDEGGTRARNVARGLGAESRVGRQEEQTVLRLQQPTARAPSQTVRRGQRVGSH